MDVETFRKKTFGKDGLLPELTRQIREWPNGPDKTKAQQLVNSIKSEATALVRFLPVSTEGRR